MMNNIINNKSDLDRGKNIKERDILNGSDAQVSNFNTELNNKIDNFNLRNDNASTDKECIKKK